MKPMPVTIPDATRDGSTTTVCRESTSMNPYLEISMNTVEARPTNVYVRNPAAFWRISRSSPISADSAKPAASSISSNQPCPTSPSPGIARSAPIGRAREVDHWAEE
jgi:hypothetical protein